MTGFRGLDNRRWSRRGNAVSGIGEEQSFKIVSYNVLARRLSSPKVYPKPPSFKMAYNVLARSLSRFWSFARMNLGLFLEWLTHIQSRACADHLEDKTTAGLDGKIANWCNRSVLIADELAAWDADIICLQVCGGLGFRV